MIPHLSTPAIPANDDDRLLSVPGVGLYSGAAKLADYQSGTVTLTHTTLYYINDTNPATHSLSLSLSRVHESNFWAGFMSSSPKITLVISEEKQSAPQQTAHWTCQICDTFNPPSAVCALCGSPAPPSASQHAAADGNSDEVPCPVCTFLNRSGATRCEICNSLLPLKVSELKLSFRKGSAPQFYPLLKRVLLNKAWVKKSQISRSATPSAGISKLPLFIAQAVL